ncbi:DoxX family protein [Streptomyces chumphonensis]|uniref:DoxX family protein n=1 Tax=Streptomyces chumphonensis TaxID=1214925 RepID=UPI003D75D0EA
MFVVYVIVTVVTALANALMAVLDLLRARFVLINAAAVSVPRSWVPGLGLLKGLGAVGLVAGVLGWRGIGVAAAGGLVLFFVGAVAVHLRARVLRTVVFPGAFLCAAVASLALGIAQGA